jgi:hypothetical protein
MKNQRGQLRAAAAPERGRREKIVGYGPRLPEPDREVPREIVLDGNGWSERMALGVW